MTKVGRLHYPPSPIGVARPGVLVCDAGKGFSVILLAGEHSADMDWAGERGSFAVVALLAGRNKIVEAVVATVAPRDEVIDLSVAIDERPAIEAFPELQIG